MQEMPTLNLRETYNTDKKYLKVEIENFLITEYNKGFKRVKIITGRGINSKKGPIIKPIVKEILQESKIIIKFFETDLGGSFEIWL